MFSKLRSLNGLILYTARRTYSACTTVRSSYPSSSTYKSRPLDLLTMASAYRQERSLSTIRVHLIKDKFYIDVEGRRAELKFNIHENVMEITHTKVPKELGGHGLGKILAKAALDFALLNGYFIRIKCAFVQHYIDKYEPQYAQWQL